jgi:glycerol kinase
MSEAFGRGFYPGPVWKHQTHKTVYGIAVWQCLKPVESIESTAAKTRQMQSLKAKGKVSVLPELTGSSLRHC